MMKKNYLIFNLILLVMFSSCSEETITGEDFGTVEGRVVNAVTFQPLANAKIFSNPSSSIVFTDADGKFSIPKVKVGEYSFEAQKDGYVTKFEAATVSLNNTVSLIFELKLSTSNNKPPTAPVLVSPDDNAVNQNLEFDLKWTGSDPDKDSLTYEIKLRKDSSNDIVVYSNIKEPTYKLKELSYSTKYYWQISASDGINEPVLSEVRSFTTTSFPNSRFTLVKKVNDNNVIYSGDNSGNVLQLTSSTANSWRPRKNNLINKIAFIRSSGSQNHIYTMNLDGSGIFKVTNSVPIAGFNSDYINYSWNTSGSQIIYPYFDKLYKINRDGSGLVKIFQTPNGKLISECDWSFDSSRIALKVNDVNGYNAEIYVIDNSGNVVSQVISGLQGAIGGLNFNVTSTILIFTRDVSGFESANYRQLDTRVFQYVFSTGIASEVSLDKPSGTIDLDARYSPNESEIIITNTSNDGLSMKNIIRFVPDINNAGTSRTVIFPDAYMPDWE